MSGSSFFSFLGSPIGLVIAALWFFLIIQLVQRLVAAHIAAALPSMNIGERRRFGMPPFNLFEYRGSTGWQRIKKIERGGPIYDIPTETRRHVEYEEKKKRRIVIGTTLVELAIALAIIKVAIRPLPLTTLLHVFDSIHVGGALITAVAANVDGLFAWLLQAANGSLWIYAVYFLQITQMTTIPCLAVMIIFGGLFAILSAFQEFEAEILYLLGAQWIKGAKVFDRRPLDPADSPREEYHKRNDHDRSSAYRAHQEKQQRQRSRPPPDDDDPFQSGGRQRAKQEQPERNPAKNFQDALWLFELSEEALTPESLQAAYKKKMLAHHPDRWNDISERTRKQLEDDLKIINAARDLIKKYKGWK